MQSRQLEYVPKDTVGRAVMTYLKNAGLVVKFVFLKSQGCIYLEVH